MLNIAQPKWGAIYAANISGTRVPVRVDSSRREGFDGINVPVIMHTRACTVANGCELFGTGMLALRDPKTGRFVSRQKAEESGRELTTVNLGLLDKATPAEVSKYLGR